MDKEHNKLQEYFDQHLNDEHAPLFIWENIAQKLDVSSTSALDESFEEFYQEEMPPALDQTFFEKLEAEESSDLKDSFEENYIAEATPSAIWTNISDVLEQDEASLLKDNFESFYEKEEVRQQVWDNIQDKMDVQNTWNKMQPQLDHLAGWYHWKKNLKRFSAAALLLLLLRTCIGDFAPEQKLLVWEDKTAAQAEPAQMITSPHNKLEQPSVSEQNTIEKDKLSPNSEDKKFEPSPSVIENHIDKGADVTLRGILNEPVEEYQTPTASSSKEEAKNNSGLDNDDSNTELPLVVEKKKPKTASNSLEQKQNNHKLSEEEKEEAKHNQKTSISDSDNFVHKVESSTNDIVKALPPKNTLEDNTNNKTTNQTTNDSDHTLSKDLIELLNLEALTPELIVIDSLELPVEEVAVLQLENNKQNLSKRFPKFELGLIGKAGTSFLLNSMTKEGMRYSSINDTELFASGNLALLGALRISPKDGIVLQFVPYNPIQQSYSAFSSRGTYAQQSIKLSYLDFSIGYERELIQFNKPSREQVASIFVRGDLGVSYLVQEHTSMNGVDVQANAFKKWNVFSALSLGSKYHVGRYVFEYGVNGSIGVTNISNNTSFLPDQTNVFSVGGFIGLRYKL